MGITSPFKLLYLLFGRCGLFTAFSLYDFTQLAAVGSDQILFQRAGFEFHHNIRFLYKGIIIKHNKTEPTYTKTSLFLCEKRRFFMARTEKGVVATI